MKNNLRQKCHFWILTFSVFFFGNIIAQESGNSSFIRLDQVDYLEND
ncbi:hypothetical protein [Salinimicrobium sp. GXAS 041]